MSKARNAGKYRNLIQFVRVTKSEDSEGFANNTTTVVLTAYAEVKTMSGITLIKNNADFEKATKRFTIRYPVTAIDYECYISYEGKTYEIKYINNIDNRDEELEIQAKEVDIHGSI